jgi:hypothetical protein
MNDVNCDVSKTFAHNFAVINEIRAVCRVDFFNNNKRYIKMHSRYFGIMGGHGNFALIW